MAKARGHLTQAEMDALDKLVGTTKRGVLKAKDVVRAARAPRHPLHNRFEWDDSKAAIQWRLEQARDVIQAYVTVINGDHTPVHALVSVATATGDEGYIPIRKALSSVETLAELRRMFARDLGAVLKRYEYLRGKYPRAFTEVERVVAALDGNGQPTKPLAQRVVATAG